MIWTYYVRRFSNHALRYLTLVCKSKWFYHALKLHRRQMKSYDRRVFASRDHLRRQLVIITYTTINSMDNCCWWWSPSLCYSEAGQYIQLTSAITNTFEYPLIFVFTVYPTNFINITEHPWRLQENQRYIEDTINRVGLYNSLCFWTLN